MLRSLDIGYALDYELESETPTKEASNGPETENGTVANSKYVNLRAEPSMQSLSMAILRNGMKVDILGEIDGFYKVKCEINRGIYKTGYISSDFIKRGD